MITKVFKNLLILSFLCFNLSLLSASELEKVRVMVEEINFEFHSKRDQSDFHALTLSMKLRTKKGEIFSQEEFDKDLKYLSEHYDKVEPKLEFSSKKVQILLNIWPKPLLQKVKFEGNQKIKSSKLRKQLEVKDKTTFDRTQFANEFRKLRTYYLKQGFYDAKMSYEVKEIEDVDEVEVRVMVEEGKPGRIANIRFEGATEKESEELLDDIYTKEHFFLTSWATGSGLYQKEAVEQDTLKVSQYFQNKGYADVQVTSHLADTPDKNERIDLTFKIEKGKVYHLGKVSFSGNQLFENSMIEPLLLAKEGEFYSPEKIYKSADQIKELYGKKGYIDCHVAQELELDIEKATFSIHLGISEGESYKVGLIKVFGNERTKPSVILHETLLVPGQTFDARRMKATEQNLMAMDYFKSVNVYTVEGESEFGKNFKDVHIEVEEKGTGKFGLFGAYSQHEKFIMGLTFQENNFDIAGISDISETGMYALRGGGENFYCQTSLGARDRKTALAWAKPHIFDSPWTFRVEADYHYRRLTNQQESKVRELAFYGVYGINAFLRAQVFYKIQNHRVYTKIDSTRLVLSKYEALYQKQAKKEAKAANEFTLASVRQEVENDTANEKKTSEEKDKLAQALYDSKCMDRFVGSLKDDIKADADRGNGVTSSIGCGLIYDSTNHPVMPNDGVYSRLTAQFSGLGGNHRFFKFDYENTAYTALSDKFTLKGKLDLHFILPKESDNFVPFNERLFLGGDTSVRGYKGPVLGPRFISTSPGGKEVISRVMRGGISSTLLSVELDYALNKYVVPYVFFDAGHLSDKKFHVGRISDFKASYGAGTQLHVLPAMPPILVGWGVPINPKYKEDDVSNFFFTIGINF